jgi:hypothetical protein
LRPAHLEAQRLRRAPVPSGNLAETPSDLLSSQPEDIDMTHLRRTMLGFVALIATLLTGAASAQVKLPQTPADHLALAKTYQDKATAYRKEAAEHRTMSEEYKKSVPGPDKSGRPNPFAKKMEDHCRAISTAADKLAADAEKMAEYHTMRAKELQGK